MIKFGGGSRAPTIIERDQLFPIEDHCAQLGKPGPRNRFSGTTRYAADRDVGKCTDAGFQCDRVSRISSQSGPSETERAKMYRNWMPQADGFQTLRADVSRRNIAIGDVACAQVAWKSS